ncbi:MAG: hydroxyacylglutathione hydrolase [SAR324 cluster bacterium]|nr:hydroxyacylglutathione hydrolase [SAR324 cluster bacterium]MBL7036191.1 hydroxyacylglutathione hydrolase [SAR324 cluster bacterium]
MEIITIPCLQDNFAYLLICNKTKQAAVVDPSEAAPVKTTVEEHGVELTTILNTHHHWDHVDGNKELSEYFPNLSIYGHDSDRGRIPGQTEFLKSGDEVCFGEQTGSFLHNPGHTSGAITYVFGKFAFTGDTMFAAGCGRLFEGTAAQMHDSLNLQIGSLADETELYFGHEYTEANLRFALSVEAGNTEIEKKLTTVRALRAEGRFSTPTTLAEERKTNPFLRCTSTEIHSTLQTKDPKQDLAEKMVFKTLRELKDKF